MFLTPLQVGTKLHFQQNRCEACILARVGGDPDVLLDLKTILLSRTRTEKSNVHSDKPTLLVYVDAWLNGLKVGNGYGLPSKTWTDGQALKTVRKQIWRERAKERKKCTAPELPPRSSEVTVVQDVPDAEDIEAAKEAEGDVMGSDMENEIIDYYAVSRSRVHVPSPVAGSGTTAVDGLSSDISEMVTCVRSRALSRPAEERAKSYQDLLARILLLDESSGD
jgi:hypothetical protein